MRRGDRLFCLDMKHWGCEGAYCTPFMGSLDKGGMSCGLFRSR